VFGGYGNLYIELTVGVEPKTVKMVTTLFVETLKRL
jgi:hypothetical protein